MIALGQRSASTVRRNFTTKSFLPPVTPNYSFSVPDSPDLASQIKTIDEFHADTWMKRSEKTNCREADHNRATVKHFIECFWTYNSNALDGSSLSLEEIMQHIALNEGLSGIAQERMSAAHNHDEAVKFLDHEVSQNILLSPALIRELHFNLWRDTDAVTAGGRYRKGNKVEHLSNDVVRAFTEPKEVAPQLQQLCDWVNSTAIITSTTNSNTSTNTNAYNKTGAANCNTTHTNSATSSDTITTSTTTQSALHPIVIAAIAHYNFHRIQPFDAGNGRVGRLVLNYVLTKYSYLPAVIRFRRRQEYAHALECANSGNITPLVVFIAEEMSYTDYIFQFFTTERYLRS